MEATNFFFPKKHIPQKIKRVRYRYGNTKILIYKNAEAFISEDFLCCSIGMVSSESTYCMYACVVYSI
jgi:hypothetical protein